MPGRANPCPIIADHGIVMTMAVFPFQILGGLSGAIFMKKYFWPLGMTLFHSTINANVSKIFIEFRTSTGPENQAYLGVDIIRLITVRCKNREKLPV